MSALSQSFASFPVEISVAVLSYNAEDRIKKCLNAINEQTRLPNEILVIDNASTDQTVQIVEREFPHIELKRIQSNTGCSGGRNRQVSYAKYPYVMLVDDDVFLSPTCLEELERAVQQFPEATIWSPRVCYEQDEGRIQMDGVFLHFIGEAVLINPERRLNGHELGKSHVRASNQEMSDASVNGAALPEEPFLISSQGGVAFLIKKEVVLHMGGYDESYFFGRTDGEFSFRLTLSGHQIYSVPRAIVYHRMKKRGLKQVERQVRNRWLLILQTYSWKTLVVLIPALLVYEVSVVAFLALKGRLPQYFKANWQVLQMFPQTLEKRRKVQAIKCRSDSNILSSGFINIRADLLSNPLFRTVHRTMNVFFKSYWIFAKRLIE
ncbi:glycosyltransferase family 2 protein [Nitrospira sp. M1]